MNPRTLTIGSLVSERLENGTDYFTACMSVSDETRLSVTVVDDCYVAFTTGDVPNVPSAEITLCNSDFEEWDDVDVNPEFPWEEGSLSVGLLFWLIPVLCVALGYVLT